MPVAPTLRARSQIRFVPILAKAAGGFNFQRRLSKAASFLPLPNPRAPSGPPSPRSQSCSQCPLPASQPTQSTKGGTKLNHMFSTSSRLASNRGKRGQSDEAWLVRFVRLKYKLTKIVAITNTWTTNAPASSPRHRSDHGSGVETQRAIHMAKGIQPCEVLSKGISAADSPPAGPGVRSPVNSTTVSTVECRESENASTRKDCRGSVALARRRV